MKVAQQLSPRLERVFECNTQVGESPLWDATNRRLYWVDIPAGLVFCGDPATGKYVTRCSTDPVGSLASIGAARRALRRGIAGRVVTLTPGL